jgi:Protein of unknown function (DUF3987)/Primase C terminal 2 (PriCT-2)/Bifunctional DNA primase/polymerase, N-terminal
MQMHTQFPTEITQLRLQLWQVGYKPVPVLRHDASVPGAGKRPTLTGWQEVCDTAGETEIYRWASDNMQQQSTNTGLLCGDIIGVDLDINNPDLAREMEALADNILPEGSLIRIGKPPKSLRLFRAETELRKSATTAFIHADGTKNQVELLGRGCQFVAFGTHPDTSKPYTWLGLSPLDVPRQNLPLLTAEVRLKFLDAAEQLIKKHCVSTPSVVEWHLDDDPYETGNLQAKDEEKSTENQRWSFEGLFPPDRQAITNAIAVLPNEADWDGWVKIGAALFDGLGDAGEELFHIWSRKSPKYDKATTATKWRSYRTSPMRSVTVATLFWAVEQHRDASVQLPNSTAVTPITADPGPDMSILRHGQENPPAFPLDALGGLWAAWVKDAADATAAPVDYVSMPLLAAASALIGHARWPSATPGWCEPPHIWCASVGVSGSSKSPASDPILRDIMPKLEARMAAGFAEKHAQWEADHARYETQKGQWRKDVEEADRQGLPPPLPPTDPGSAPEQPRLTQSDVTVERLAVILANAAPKGILVVRDELAGWLLGMKRYNESDRAFWLEGYGGRSHRVERQKHPEPILIPRLAVSVFGTIQPDRLAELFKDANDGLLARFLWAWPASVPFRISQVAPNIGWATAALDRLRQLEPELDFGGLDEDDGGAAPVLVPLTSDAVLVLEEFARYMQVQAETSGGLLSSAYGKARGLALRLSAILTFLIWCAEPEGTPEPTKIDAESVARACVLVGEYFMPMARRVYGDAAVGVTERAATTLARWIYKQRPTEVNVRHLLRTVRLEGLRGAKECHGALERLIELGWVTPPANFATETTRPGRRPETYRVNPAVFGNAS